MTGITGVHDKKFFLILLAHLKKTRHRKETRLIPVTLEKAILKDTCAPALRGRNDLTRFSSSELRSAIICSFGRDSRDKNFFT